MNKHQPQTANHEPRALKKSFMAAGPTLHYSHKNVQRCFALVLIVFGLTCIFWSKILTGSFWSFSVLSFSPEFWHLDRFALTGTNHTLDLWLGQSAVPAPISIFEYPWQIAVLGLLMGILAIIPVLASQLMSFRYSLPFILAVFFLANLPLFAICLLISCVAVACRPLRFRSRFIAIALCMMPQLFYWGYFGPVRSLEPLKWAFSFIPWICAWIISLTIAALVLGIGHFTRYKPGLLVVFTAVFFLFAIVTFETKIGFDELDYQLYVAKNNPEQIIQFHDHSISKALDKTLANPMVRRYLAGFFYPTEPILLRQQLRREIQIQLTRDRWPAWFIVPPELRYQDKRRWLFQQYDFFIARRPKSHRMPIALYYKAILSEYSPDIKLLGQKEILHFYSDYPHQRSRKVWYRLYDEFGNSPESLEARWRIAMHLAGAGRFQQADKLLAQAEKMLTQRLKMLQNQQIQGQPAHHSIRQSFLSLFQPPPDSVMTEFKLTQLHRRLNQLRTLISAENRTDQPASKQRLAKFVILNPHSQDYVWQLNNLLQQMKENDPLRDNVLLAKAKLIADHQLRAERLAQIHQEFQHTDGGMAALYELAHLKIDLYQTEPDAQKKAKHLADARALLTTFISLYPNSFYAQYAKKNLDNLPRIN